MTQWTTEEIIRAIYQDDPDTLPDLIVQTATIGPRTRDAFFIWSAAIIRGRVDLLRHLIRMGWYEVGSYGRAILHDQIAVIRLFLTLNLGIPDDLADNRLPATLIYHRAYDLLSLVVPHMESVDLARGLRVAISGQDVIGALHLIRLGGPISLNHTYQQMLERLLAGVGWWLVRRWPMKQIPWPPAYRAADRVAAVCLSAALPGRLAGYVGQAY